MNYLPNISNVVNMVAGAFKSATSMAGLEYGLAAVGLRLAEANLIALTGPTVGEVPVLGGLLVNVGIPAYAAALGLGLQQNSGALGGGGLNGLGPRG